jgi:hypothetical protein
MAGRGGIETLLGLMDEAFRGVGLEASNESQALLNNISSVTNEQWRALVPGASRTIADIASHVGSCKVMYDDYAFGPGALQWGTPEAEPYVARGTRDEVVAWLEASQARLVGHVAELVDDVELDVPRMTNWGELRPTRWIVAAMITHDAYHAGEINHVRSLLDGDDRWRFQQLGYG